VFLRKKKREKTRSKKNGDFDKKKNRDLRKKPRNPNTVFGQFQGAIPDRPKFTAKISI
jgi:hypothetical protein